MNGIIGDFFFGCRFFNFCRINDFSLSGLCIFFDYFLELKNNNLLASAQIEDIDASVNVTVFDKAYAIYKPYLTDSKPVILSGRISEREDRDTEIICEKIEPIPENIATNQTATKYKSGLYLKVLSTESDVFAKVKAILSQNRGEIPVYIFCTSTNKKLQAPRSLYVDGNDLLISELSGVLGQENVKFIN